MLALIVYLGMMWNNQRLASDEKVVEVYIGGELVDSHALEEEGTYRYETEEGFNVVTISNGQAFMSEADCPTLSCIQEGSIEHVNETVVCLPHKFHIVIKGVDTKENEIDAISQ